ncbi:MAG: nuclear transport factor 2 family protein [Terriglobales bacterium]|jgi:ketosteroid isomerase-like protein
MSRQVWLVSILFVALVHAQPKKPERSAPEPRADALREQIVAQERAGLDALKTGDLAKFGASTADDAIFVDAHGPATKAEVMEHTAEFRLHDYTMSDVRFIPLSAESGMIIYTVTESGTSHGKDFSARVYVSSLWLKRGGKWLCEFSQETGAR